MNIVDSINKYSSMDPKDPRLNALCPPNTLRRDNIILGCATIGSLILCIVSIVYSLPFIAILSLPLIYFFYNYRISLNNTWELVRNLAPIIDDCKEIKKTVKRTSGENLEAYTEKVLRSMKRTDRALSKKTVLFDWYTQRLKRKFMIPPEK